MKSLKKNFPILVIVTLFSTNAFSMGAKRPTAADVKTAANTGVGQVVKSVVTQALPLFWNIPSAPAPTGIARALPLIENLLPLFGSVSPLLSTALPVIETVVRVGTQIRESQVQVQTFGGPYLDQIKMLAENSSCAETIWKNGTKAPAGFIKGMALSFARSSCRLKKSESTPSALVNILINAVAKKNPLDGLQNYKNIFANLGLSLNTNGDGPLRAVYLLNMGTAMAENGGVYCKTTDSLVEAYGSKLTSTVLSKLLAEYKGGNALRCFVDVFQEGTNCGSSTTGNNSATAYNQSCPAFGAELAATMLRVQGTTYKSVASNQAEIVPACDELLKNVQDMIDQDPENACADIN